VILPKDLGRMDALASAGPPPSLLGSRQYCSRCTASLRALNRTPPIAIMARGGGCRGHTAWNAALETVVLCGLERGSYSKSVRSLGEESNRPAWCSLAICRGIFYVSTNKTQETARPMRQPTRTACLSLLYAIALSARPFASNATQDLAQELKVHWKENPTPNVHFELKEAEREKQGGTTHVAYQLETAGFPAGKTFALWIRQSGNQLIFPVLGNYGADSNGKLVCPEELSDAKSAGNSGADKEKAAESQPPAPGEKKLGCMSLVNSARSWGRRSVSSLPHRAGCP
jgi:hypothetical protein